MNNQPQKSKKRLADLICQTKLALQTKNKWPVSQLRQTVVEIGRRLLQSPAPRRLLISTAIGAALLGGTLVPLSVSEAPLL